MQPRLVISPQSPDLAASLGRETGLHPSLSQVMVNRGHKTAGQIKAFLSPGLNGMANPFDLPDLEKAAERLALAVVRGEKIGLFGDYDADGVTSTAVFINFFRRLGREVAWYLPNRLTEGYGLNRAGIKRLAREGVSLLVTADCGTSDLEALALARELGLETILTDHHQLGLELPQVLAFVNPHRPEGPAQFKNLAGVGVVFFLLAGLRAKLREHGYFRGREEPNLKEHLDLVALGTLADVVPVVGQNRIILTVGLSLGCQASQVGLSSLAQVAGCGNGTFSAREVAFSLAPRVNAPGRMGQAELGVELLTAADTEQAQELARKMDRLNNQRRKIGAEVLAQALDQIESRGDPVERMALVAAHPEWHPGVLGIVATRISQKYHRPCFILRIQGETAVGSGRSIEPFPLHRGLAELSEHLVRFGGHSQAAGLTIRTDRIEGFSLALEAEIGRVVSQPELIPSLNLDACLDLDDLNEKLVDDLERMAPFGPGNQEPVFLAERVGLISAQQVGRGGVHLRLRLRQGQQTWSAIGFNLGHRLGDLSGSVRIAFKPFRNTFRGRSKVEVQVEAIEQA